MSERTMTALLPTPGGDLLPAPAPMPEPGPGEVLLRVRAAGVNRADLAQRAGMYPPPPGVTHVLGLEVAGEVVGLGDGLDWDQPADPELGVGQPGALTLVEGAHACALLPGGGYAEYAAVPAALLVPIPPGWSFADAAAWPEAAFTVFLNVFIEAGMQAGESLLVHGGASGVGTMAIAMAKESGAAVYATAGGPEKVAACLELGADLALDRHAGDFEEALSARGLGADVVLDMVGRAYFAANLRLLRPGGRLVFIATLSGGEVELDLRTLMAKRLRLIGSTLRARPVAEKVAVKRAIWRRFGAALMEGRLRPVVERRYPWQEAGVAHERMRANLNVGKLVLELR